MPKGVYERTQKCLEGFKSMALFHVAEKNRNWKGGVSKQAGYAARMIKSRRHKKGINVDYRKPYNYTAKQPKAKSFIDSLRTKIMNAEMNYRGKLSLRTVQTLYEDNIKTYGTLTCYLCYCPIPFGADELEHKVSATKGGTNNYNNLAIACRGCNRRKYTKTVNQFKSQEVKRVFHR